MTRQNNENKLQLAKQMPLVFWAYNSNNTFSPSPTCIHHAIQCYHVRSKVSWVTIASDILTAVAT
jgi:hypothetical protein